MVIRTKSEMLESCLEKWICEQIIATWKPGSYCYLCEVFCTFTLFWSTTNYSPQIHKQYAKYSVKILLCMMFSKLPRSNYNYQNYTLFIFAIHLQSKNVTNSTKLALNGFKGFGAKLSVTAFCRHSVHSQNWIRDSAVGAVADCQHTPSRIGSSPARVIQAFYLSGISDFVSDLSGKAQTLPVYQPATALCCCECEFLATRDS